MGSGSHMQRIAGTWRLESNSIKVNYSLGDEQVHIGLSRMAELRLFSSAETAASLGSYSHDC